MSILTVSNWSLYAGIVSFARSVSLEKVLYRSVLDCCHCCFNLCLTPNFISKMNKSDRQKRREAFKKLPYAEKIARTEANERKKQLLLYKREQTLKKLNHYSKCQAKWPKPSHFRNFTRNQCERISWNVRSGRMETPSGNWMERCKNSQKTCLFGPSLVEKYLKKVLSCTLWRLNVF